ncbi:MAG: WecB/TagA/CpsF family glycosyltransferase [Armatimonadetes bacterium]|nr:WecB/TagA/CpsF family glycosyltransferase [Armatimonadota bacterium]
MEDARSPSAAVAVLCAAALAALLVYAFGWVKRLARGRAPDLTGLPVLGAIWATGAIMAGLGGQSGQPHLEPSPWLGAATLALAVLGLWIVLSAIDLLKLPRGIPAIWTAVLVAVVGGGEPLIQAIKLPITGRLLNLGATGWFFSWAWVWLYGSMFARAGPITSATPGLAAVGAAVFWAVAVLQPGAVGAVPGCAAVLCLGSAVAVAALHRVIHDGRKSSGAFALGSFLGVIAALGMLKNAATVGLLVPLLVVGMPLFAAVAPAGQRRPGQKGAPAHLHEVLWQQGFTPGQIAAVEIAGAAYLGFLAVVLVGVRAAHPLAKLVLVVAWTVAGLLGGRLLLRVLPRPGLAASGPVEVELFGVRLHALTMQQALDRAREFLRSDRPHYIVTCDASALSRAQDDPEFRRIVNQADLVTADGAGVVLAARLLGMPVQARVSGCDLVEGLCRVAAEEAQSVFFLGAEPGVAEEAARRLRDRVPGLVVAGCQHGYYPAEEEEEIVRKIAAARPGLLIVALGQGRQEKFIADNLQRIGARVAIGVGGSLDVISGRKRRAPVWMQRVGLEWLYRVAKEPWRLPRLKALPRVALMALVAALRQPAMPEERNDKQ